jgi:predicted RNase H-like HicB family nuclease
MPFSTYLTNRNGKMTTKNYLRQPYTRALIPDENGGYFAEILEFPGCFAEGDTVEKAYKELEGAAKSWIEARISQGLEVPKPFDSLGHSGTISLRLPRTIHKRAAIMAERDRVSLNSFLSTAIASRVGAEDFYSNLARRFTRELVQTAIWIRSEHTKDKLIQPLQIQEHATLTFSGR